MVDIARPESVVRKKKMKRAAYGVVGLTAVLLITVVRLAFEARGPVHRARHGVARHGQARSDGSPGARHRHARPRRHPLDSRNHDRPRRAHRAPLRRRGETRSIIVELSNPELERTVVEARCRSRAAQAQLTNRRAELESALLTQRATAANVESEWRQAQLRAEADAALLKDGLIDALNAKINMSRADGSGASHRDRKEATAGGGRDAEVADSPCRNPRSSA